jgi:hypothetical protein
VAQLYAAISRLITQTIQRVHTESWDLIKWTFPVSARIFTNEMHAIYFFLAVKEQVLRDTMSINTVLQGGRDATQCPWFSFFFFGKTGIWTQGFALAKRMLYPHLQSILLWLFWRWGLSNYLPGLSLNLHSSDLSLPSSRITGTSHWRLDPCPDFY